ncbi:MAG: PTS mannose/fructose/sorbose/N-acetylgalactosamine transporter subunit IIC [Mycobacterium leprae]
MSFITALILGVVAGLLYLSRRLLGDMQLERPIVVGPLVGLILGDVKTGLEIGAAFELIFMGAQAIGGAVPPNLVIAGILGSAFAITTGKGVEAALVVAVPAALVGTTFELFAKTVSPIFVHGADKYAEEGNIGGINLMFALGNLLHFLAYAVPVFVALYFGANSVSALTAMIPARVMHGIQAAGNLLPALGFGLLLNSLGAKHLMPYFFIGFAIAAYTGFGVMGVAVLAVAIAILLQFRSASN